MSSRVVSARSDLNSIANPAMYDTPGKLTNNHV